MEVSFHTSGQQKLKSLILIYFFIGNIKAECPQPEAYENTIPSDQALLLNEFPEGSEITIECGNGYFKESGSDIVRCISDKWTEPELICKKKDCGPIQPQPHMHFDFSEGTLFGAKAKLSCDDGYTIRGLSFARCYNAGWRFSSGCEIVTCSRPSEVANGRNSWNSEDVPKMGEIIIYSCDKGYSINGNGQIECLNSGEYNSQPPECIGVTTEDTFTTKSITSAPASTEQAFTSAAHRVTKITASASPTTSASERGVTTEDTFTTKLVTSFPASTEAETSYSSGSFSTSAAHRDTAVPASASPTTPASEREIPPEIVNPNKDNMVLFVTTSMLACLLVFLVVGLILWRFLLRRKGSTAGTAPI
ncbi:CD55 molecule (Cromer blood group) [Nothobranchius furzeri]|uniref:CD55 molecule (Cromer blood group) n=1 Tax=Nothobranchius furzeri TaxID=105023 RepID=A0A9D3BHH8_NOTFU|nr:CD55 molecule (Cromer blood group) [Nothobranchius furzeri]